MRTPALILLTALAACGRGEGDPDASPVADAPAQPDAAGQPDAADPLDAADSPDAADVTPDALVTDAAIAEGAVINEALLDDNVQGSDTTEFIEIFGDPDTDYSALTVLQVDGDVGPDGPGKIISIHPVGTTDGSGFWATDFLSNTLQNGTQTLLLVQGFTGAVGQDYDANDDGTFDTTPWIAILDAVAFLDDSGTNVTYAGGAVLGTTFGGAARIPDGADSDGTSEWVKHHDGTTPVSGEANPTRGAPNELDP